MLSKNILLSFIFLSLLFTTIFYIYIFNYNCGDTKIEDLVNENIVYNRTFVFQKIYEEQAKFKTQRYIYKKVVDKYYHPIKLYSLKRFLRLNRLNYVKYVNDTMDCDNFSIDLYAKLKRNDKYYKHSLLFGIIVGKVHKNDNIFHSINFFITEKDNFYCLEPQNDKITYCNDTFYYINFIMV